MPEYDSSSLIIEFDAGQVSVEDLQAMVRLFQESGNVAPAFSHWIVNEFLLPELQRRQSEPESPAQRYFKLPANWTDAQIAKSLVMAVGMTTGADFAPSARLFLTEIAQQVAGMAASRLMQRS